MGFAFKSKASKPVRGGSGHMVGKTSAGPSKPNKPVNTGGGGKWAKGGSGHMVGKTGVRPAKAC
jgi:hypothetical protein